VEFKISSYCSLGNSVEAGFSSDGSVVVRRSRDADRATSLVFTREEWISFVQGVKAGEFDPPEDVTDEACVRSARLP